MKQKMTIRIVLILVATISSVAILSADGYFDKPKVENKILSVEPTVANPIVLAKATTSVKKPTIAKKAPIKKAPIKKKAPVKKKKSVNLAPAIITTATAPHSAKNKSN